MVDDVVFYTSLLICISLGSYYKKIKAPDLKRSYGAGLGLLVTCLICGHEMYHSMFMVWGNVIIIKCCDKRYVHQVSMAYTWTYLLYLHTNLTCTVYVCWLHQTMALRLVGLAFEVNSEQGPVQGPIPGTSQQPSTSHTSAVKLTTSVSKQSQDNGKPVEPSAVDIISYSYFFIGLHKGPYYRWKIFNDHFNSKFGTLGDCRLITEQKLKKAVACALGCLILNTRYSKTVYEDDEFYINYGSDYRFLYNMPQLLTYFLYTQMIMMFCTSVYTEAGFGVYPAVCEPIPGHGPTSRLSLLKLASLKEDVALEQEYNFVMLKCFENNRLLLGPKMKDSLKGWDMPTRYWFWANIYKKLLNANKEVRSASSFFAWSIWYGPTLQQMIVAATLWVYIHLEDEYSSIYNTSGQMKWSWSIGFSIMRAFCFIYLTPCFVLTNTQTVLRYYHSIFWLYHFLLGILIVGAIVAQKSKL